MGTFRHVGCIIASTPIFPVVILGPAQKNGDKERRKRQKIVRPWRTARQDGWSGETGAPQEMPRLLDQLSTDLGPAEVRVSPSPKSRTEPLSGDETTRARLMENLPPPNTKRWVVRRKAAMVAAVRGGGITIEEACRYYQLSEEEFLSWERAFERHGLAGLRTTRVQQYRAPRSRRG